MQGYGAPEVELRFARARDLAIRLQLPQVEILALGPGRKALQQPQHGLAVRGHFAIGEAGLGRRDCGQVMQHGALPVAAALEVRGERRRDRAGVPGVPGL